MKRYLSLRAIHVILNSVDQEVFSDPTSISPDTLWALAENALVNPMYRAPDDCEAYQQLFLTAWPTEQAQHYYDVAVSMLEVEPFFVGLGINRYLSPASVHITDQTFMAIWSE
jgi:hypothetical protein